MRVTIWACPLPAKPALLCHSAGESEVPHRGGDREEGGGNCGHHSWREIYTSKLRVILTLASRLCIPQGPGGHRTPLPPQYSYNTH